MRETHNLEFADRFRAVAEFYYTNSRLFFFIIALSRTPFCRVPASVCEAQLRLGANLAISKGVAAERIKIKLWPA